MHTDPLQDLDSAATAAREFAEETLGLFGDCGVDAASVVSEGTGCGFAWLLLEGGSVHWCSMAVQQLLIDQRWHKLRFRGTMQALAAAIFEARLRDPLQALKASAADSRLSWC